jgi:hypothetical protein
MSFKTIKKNCINFFLYIYILGKEKNIFMKNAKYKKLKGKHIEKWSIHSFLTTAPQQADVAGNILLFFCFLFFSFCKKIRKMIDLQHHHNNCTTPPHMEVGPSVWGPPPCEEVLCRNQIPKNNKILSATSACCGVVVRNECRDHFSSI